MSDRHTRLIGRVARSMTFSFPSLLVAALAIFVATESLAVTVSTARPRMFVTPADLPELRARVGITDGNNQTTHSSQWNSHSSEWNGVVNYANGLSWDGSDNRSTKYHTQITCAAFVYLLSGNGATADAAIDLWMQYAQDSGSGISENWFGHSTGFYYAAAYDWLYDRMSSTERSVLGQWMWDAVGQMEVNGWIDPNDLDESDHSYHGSYHSSAVVTCLLALYGSGVQNDATLQNRIDYYVEYKKRDFLSHYASYGLGSFGGYAQYILVPDVLGAWGIQSATDYDLFNTTIIGSNGNAHMAQYFRGVGNWVMATHRSDMSESEQPGDGYYSELNSAASEGRTAFLPYKFVQEYGEPFLKWFLDNPYSQKFGGGGNVSLVWQIVCNDKTAPSDPNATPSYVQNNCDDTQGGFGCGGHHVIRPSWDYNTSDYTHLIVTAGAAHQHWRLASPSSYDLTYGPWMLTGQTAAYDATTTVYFEEYNRRSWAFNTIDVDGIGFNRGSQPQIETVTTIHRPNDRYLGLAADVTSTTSNPSNSSSPVVSLFEREWAVVDDDFVVVFDRVIALDSNDEKVINIHSYDKNVPDLLDGSWDGGASQNSFGGTPGTTSSTGTRFAFNGIDPLNPTAVGPRLLTTIVCPHPYTLRLVGGPNSNGVWNTGNPSLRTGTDTSKWGTTESIYPATTNDLSGRLGQHDISFEGYNRKTQRNYPFNENGFDSDVERNGNAGRWRVEVVPETGRAEDVVMTVHEIVPTQFGDGAAVLPIFSVEQRPEGLPQFVGATIGDGDGHVVMYNTASQGATSVTYESQSSVLPFHHRIRGMQPGSYSVFLDGEPELIVDSVAGEEFIAFEGSATRVEVRPLMNAHAASRVAP